MARRSPDAFAAAVLAWLLCAGLAQGAVPDLRPLFKPKPAAETPEPSAPEYSTAGSVCGVAAIKGVTLKPILDRQGCGIDAPVRVTSVSGVQLSPAPVIDCSAAKAVNEWVDTAAAPAFSAIGGGLAELQVAGGYACRPRNNQPGAKLSEHAEGKAIDISGFSLRDGNFVSVGQGWQSSRLGPTLEQAHNSACASFSTVLGPKSNRFHQDHFHLDTAQRHGGAYCR